MPKKIKPPSLKEDMALVNNILFLCDSRGVSRGKLLAVIGCSNSTYCAKMANPEKFSYGELKRIARVFNVPVAKLITERKWIA